VATGIKDIDTAIRDLTTKLIDEMKKGNPGSIGGSAASENPVPALEGLELEKALGQLVKLILHHAKQTPAKH